MKLCCTGAYKRIVLHLVWLVGIMGARKNVVEDSEHKLYKRRWLMLGLCMLHAFNGSQQWAQFTIISNLVTKYYNATATQVEWTGNIFMVAYVVLVVPSLYLVDKVGMRYTMTLSSLGSTVGTWIKLCSVAPDRFYLAFSGQCCSGVFLMLTYGLMVRLAALWFGAKEISTASVLTLLGNQIGVASAFFFPSIFVKDGPIEEIGNGLKNLNLTVAISSTITLLLILLCKPKVPPSISQVKQQQIKQEKIFKYIFVMFKKRSFILFMFTYGLNISAQTAISTLLNELVVGNFPGHAEDAGRIGSLMMISGTISSLIIGRVLDKTRLFKECAVFLCSCSVISLGAFTWSLKSGNILYVYVTSLSIGFFFLGYYTTGIQLGVELTYPVPEQISTSIAVLSAQVFSLISSVVYGYAIKIFGDLTSNIGLLVITVIALIAALCVPRNLKRQQAENEPKKCELKQFL